MKPDDIEIIVVDDGSSDDTLRLAHDVYGSWPHTQFIQQPFNKGKGAAVRLGIAAASGDYVVTADADMSINPRHLPEMIAALGSTQVVPGSRTDHGHIDYDSTLRTVAGKVFSRLARHYSGTALRDTQCGFKGFQRGPARLLGLLGMVDRFAFDPEMFYLAHETQMTVSALKVTWDDVGGSSVRLSHDVLTMIKDLRAIPRTRYVNPVVQLERDVSVADIERHARQTRVRGLVVARGDNDALLVLPRDGSLAGLGIAEGLKGTLRTARLEEFRQRSFDAV
jgi:dolichyl-phosphate beta-glucosyltransferase